VHFKRVPRLKSTRLSRVLAFARLQTISARVGGAGDGGLASDMSLKPAVCENTPGIIHTHLAEPDPTLSLAAAAVAQRCPGQARGEGGVEVYDFHL